MHRRNYSYWLPIAVVVLTNFLGVGHVIAAEAPSATHAGKSLRGEPPQDDFIAPLVAFEENLGSDQWRIERLSKSPRSHADISLKGLGVTQQALIVTPEGERSVPAILMVPEDQGLNTWARSMADDLAAMGYIVIVPDLLSGRGPNQGGRESFKNLRDVFEAHSRLPRTDEPSMVAQLNLWADHARSQPRFNGKLAVVGFAWGAGRALWFAAQRADLAATFAFYDTAPPINVLKGLSAPVYGFYAGIDPRVVASLPATEAAMHTLGKQYESVIYPRADHMFVRLGEEPRNQNPANISARNDSLARLQTLLEKM